MFRVNGPLPTDTLDVGGGENIGHLLLAGADLQLFDLLLLKKYYIMPQVCIPWLYTVVGDNPLPYSTISKWGVYVGGGNDVTKYCRA